MHYTISSWSRTILGHAQTKTLISNLSFSNYRHVVCKCPSLLTTSQGISEIMIFLKILYIYFDFIILIGMYIRLPFLWCTLCWNFICEVTIYPLVQDNRDKSNRRLNIIGIKKFKRKSGRRTMFGLHGWLALDVWQKIYFREVVY